MYCSRRGRTARTRFQTLCRGEPEQDSGMKVNIDSATPSSFRLGPETRSA